MSKHHKTQKIKGIMNTASFLFFFLPPPFCFPNACKECITKLQVSGKKGLGRVGGKGPGGREVNSFQNCGGRQNPRFQRLDVASASRGERPTPLCPLAPALQLCFSEAVPCSDSNGHHVLALSPSQGLLVVPRPGITQLPLNTWLQMRTLEKKQ